MHLYLLEPEHDLLGLELAGLLHQVDGQAGPHLQEPPPPCLARPLQEEPLRLLSADLGDGLGSDYGEIESFLRANVVDQVGEAGDDVPPGGEELHCLVDLLSGLYRRRVEPDRLGQTSLRFVILE